MRPRCRRERVLRQVAAGARLHGVEQARLVERLGADQHARAAVRAQLADELAAALDVAVEDEHVGQLEVLVQLGGPRPVRLPYLLDLVERGQAG